MTIIYQLEKSEPSESSGDELSESSGDEAEPSFGLMLESNSNIGPYTSMSIEKESSIKEYESCEFKKPCIRDLKNSLVDSTKENPAFYTILSGLTAAVGLATNSPATIIGSMLLSPIGDIIVRLSIIGKFDEFKKNGRTKYNFSRQAFQERYLDKLGIPSEKIFINTKKNGDLHIELSDKNINGEIDNIYKYNDIVYFSYDKDQYLYDINGEKVFIVNLKNTETRYGSKPNKKDKTCLEKIKDFFSMKKKELVEYKSLEEKFPGIEIKKIDDNENLAHKFYSITTSDIARNIRKYELQDINPFADWKAGSKYNWYHVFGWGILICFLAILIGFLCGLIFITSQNNQKEPNFLIPTKEMEDRGKIENAIGMIFIAICSGIILPEAIRYKNTIRMVGIGIATALLPPLVNMGLYLAVWAMKDKDENNKMKHTDKDGNRVIPINTEVIYGSILTSFVIFLINFVLLYWIAKTRLSNICDGEKGIFKDFDLC